MREELASLFSAVSTSITHMNEPAIGIIGGSGLYHLGGFSNLAEHKVDTPFGAPSDSTVGGTMFGRSVYFLPRHGRGHRILPHELNHRANIYALRSLHVRWISCVTADVEEIGRAHV